VVTKKLTLKIKPTITATTGKSSTKRPRDDDEAGDRTFRPKNTPPSSPSSANTHSEEELEVDRDGLAIRKLSPKTKKVDVVFTEMLVLI
jgi:hypothetical protein